MIFLGYELKAGHQCRVRIAYLIAEQSMWCIPSLPLS